MDAKTALAKIGGGQKKSRKPKGLPKRTGKRAAKYTKYFQLTRPRRKLTRILKSNGYQAAKAWADTNACLSLLSQLTK